MKDQPKQAQQVCAVTGKALDEPQALPFRNQSGDLIGLIFLSDHVIKHIQDYRIGVVVDWEYTGKSKKPEMKLIMPNKIIGKS